MKKILVSLVVFTALHGGGFAQTELSDGALLQALDDARYVGSTSLTFTSEVVAERPDGTSQAVVRLFLKENENGEQLSRIEFLEPEDMAGEVFISTPEGTFLWNPDLFEPLRISDRQEVFGDASVAETAGIRFANGDYAVALREPTSLEDGAPGLAVTLQATDPGVAFQSVQVIVNEATHQPVQMTLFALGGDPINRVTFQRYNKLDQDEYAEQQLIESLFVEGNKTLLTITNIEVGELSDDLFNPDLLGQDE